MSHKHCARCDALCPMSKFVTTHNAISQNCVKCRKYLRNLKATHGKECADITSLLIKWQRPLPIEEKYQ